MFMREVGLHFSFPELSHLQFWYQGNSSLTKCTWKYSVLYIGVPKAHVHYFLNVW